MTRVRELDPRDLATVWASNWLKRAEFQRRSGLGRALDRLGGWLRREKATDPDYFSRLAEIPGVPDECRARAMAIVLHQRRLAALYRLLIVDEVTASSRTQPRQAA